MRQPQAGQEGKRWEMQPLPGSPRLQAREPRIITRVAGFGEAICLPCFRRRKRPLSGRENSLLYVQNIHHCRRHSSSTGSGSGRSYCTRFLRFHTRIHNHNRSLLPLHHSLLVPPSSMFDYTASYDPQLARVSMFCKNFRKFFLVRAVFCSIIGAFSGSL